MEDIAEVSRGVLVLIEGGGFMLAKINSAGLHGLDGYPVCVQVDESNGLPRSVIVGNVSANVREALDRCTVAMKNAELPLPPKRLTINLQPADRRKDGSGFDLPILLGMLLSLGLVACSPPEDYGFFGEVGLDGEIRHVRGALSLVTALQEAGLRGAVVPEEDAAEASVVEGMDIIGVRSISDLRSLLSSEESFRSFQRGRGGQREESEPEKIPDFSDVRGQSFSVRAALIAAAGKHNLLLSGPAGSGKSMIAKRIPGILPPLSRKEDIEITKLYSIAGMLPKGRALYGKRPFRSPHHSITSTALLGGSGPGGIVPGELPLALNGVLFLDELPLFSKSSIEGLRQPMEDRFLVIQRLSGSFRYPADCLLIAAMNPCPCGHFPDRRRCRCTPSQIRSYQRGISKPILERMDLCVEVSPVSYEDARSRGRGISSERLREDVIRARELQRERFRGLPIRCNSEMGIGEIERFCALREKEERFMRRIFQLKQLSMRTYHKLLKTARTIADLSGEPEIGIPQLSEAVSYRSLEERLFGEEAAL